MADFYDDPGGLVIQVANPITSGTGTYNTFLGIQSPGAETDEQGFNLDQDFLDATLGANTHTLQFSDLFSDATDQYFVFRLDINEPNEAEGEVTLTKLQFWAGSAATELSRDGSALSDPNLSLKYELTGGPVPVMTDHSHGSGTDDYVIFVPKSYFAGVDPTSYLTVYAKFTGGNGGFEEFASAPTDDDVVHPGGDFSVGIIKDTLAFGSSVEGKTVLVGTQLTWTYSVTTGGGDPIPRDLLTVTDDHNLVITYQSGDDGDDLLELGETWLYTATGVATAGQYNNIGTATVTTEAGQDAVTDFDTSSYFGADPKIAITKVTTGTDSASHTNTGDGINVVTGTNVLWTYTLTNTGNEPLSDVKIVDDMGTPATADDVTLTAANTHTGDIDLDGKLDTNETWVFTLGGTAKAGDYANLATASGSFTDDTSHTSTATASDDSSYHAFTFGQSTPGLTIGYWYNHQSAWTSYLVAQPTGTQITNKDGSHTGILLGDANGNHAIDAGETTLWMSKDAAAQLINSSQTATDTRQILMSQAIATQLNIDAGTKDPGYDYVTHNADGALITEAVKWLRGLGDYHWTNSTGNVDSNHNGVLDVAEYNPGLKTATLTADGNLSQSGTQVLTSSLSAWQAAVTYDAFDYNHIPKPAPGDTTVDFWANGEGLKNALQAVNQNHLVVDTAGQVVAWNESGSATGPYTELHLNGPNDFWVVLSDEYPSHTALLKGIWA
jgi:hypothetical protein